MIDHVTISVSDLERSRAFYENAFTPFHYKVSFGEEGNFWAFDIGDSALFEIAQHKATDKLTSFHIAFRAENQEQVRQFYEAALAAGGKCQACSNEHFSKFIP